MSKLSEKTTIYLDPYVKKFLQLMALQQSKPMSELINNHFADTLRKFEKHHKHPSVIEWQIVKKDLDKKRSLLK